MTPALARAVFRVLARDIAAEAEERVAMIAIVRVRLIRILAERRIALIDVQATEGRNG